MSTQQDIYAAGSENRPPMLNKDNYVPWSSRIIRYARSRPNGKIIVDSIENGPYVRRMITTPGEPDLPVPDRQIHNVGGNGGNQFGQYAGQVAQSQQGFNVWQNGGIQGAQNESVQSDGN
nr:ribonuclease H-like domain-containing protein [Tanacetum cinerariifolium]